MGGPLNSTDMRATLRELNVAEKIGLAGALLPFVVKLSSVRSETQNGEYVLWEYRDWAQIAGGALALACSVIGLVLVLRSSSTKKPIHFAIVGLMALLGTYQVLHGTGTIGGPAVHTPSSNEADVALPVPTEQLSDETVAVAEGTDDAPTPSEVAITLATLEKGCDSGQSGQCVSAGVAYADGKGVPSDATRAAGLYQKACDQNDEYGCLYLAYLTEDGTGVEKSVLGAQTLFQKSCDLGQGEGCSGLADYYDQGIDVSKDQARAFALYVRGCDLDHAHSCSMAGRQLAKGEGVDVDEVRAVKLFIQGCDGGSGTGCLFASTSYRDGFGVTADAALAAEYKKRACDLGRTQACENAETSDSSTETTLAP